MIRIAGILLVLLVSFGTRAAEVRTISFTGLTRTNESFLRGIIQLKEGAVFSDTLLDEDVFLLKNLNLFFDVHGTATNVSPASVDVVFKIKEANYIYPILSASGFNDQLKLQLGVNDINFLGRAQSFGILYQFYDRHSFSLFHTSKRHINNKTGHELALAKYSTLEPLYSFDTVSNFNFDNYSASAGGYYWLGKYLNAHLGGAYMYERYNQQDNGFSIGGGKTSFAFHKHQLRSSVNYDKVAHVYERRDGFAWKVYGEWIYTYGNESKDARFLKLLIQQRWYKLVGEGGNLAVGTRFGLATNRQSPFSPFVLDGFLNVRGIGNRIERGTAELIGNIEYQQRIIQHKYVTVQLAGFSDYGALRSPGLSFASSLSTSTPNLFVGGGIRLHLNVFYKTSFRLDYSVNPFLRDQKGVTFGFGQFF